jgi:ribosomal protein L40E
MPLFGWVCKLCHVRNGPTRFVCKHCGYPRLGQE